MLASDSPPAAASSHQHARPWPPSDECKVDRRALADAWSAAKAAADDANDDAQGAQGGADLEVTCACDPQPAALPLPARRPVLYTHGLIQPLIQHPVSRAVAAAAAAQELQSAKDDATRQLDAKDKLLAEVSGAAAGPGRPFVCAGCLPGAYHARVVCAC